MNNTQILYPNIANFLKSNDFLIKSLELEKIVFYFNGKEIVDAYEKHVKLQEKGDEETNNELSDKYYIESWETLIKVQKKYYPKIEPVLLLLNDFYKNNSTPLEFKLILENHDLRLLNLGFNPLFYDMYPDKKLFKENIAKELQSLDMFIEQN